MRPARSEADAHRGAGVVGRGPGDRRRRDRSRIGWVGTVPRRRGHPRIRAGWRDRRRSRADVAAVATGPRRRVLRPVRTGG